MSCKYNNSMYTLNVPDLEEYDEFDIYEDIPEPEDDIDYSFADQEAKELAHFKKLVSKYSGHFEESDD